MTSQILEHGIPILRTDRCRLLTTAAAAAWPASTDQAIHAALRKLFDSGVTIVNVHSGQRDQKKIIEFYGRSALPEFAA